MDKHARQRAIRRLVERRTIGNQLQLVAALRRLGISATQASVSRDVRELGLVKAGGRYVPGAKLLGQAAARQGGDPAGDPPAAAAARSGRRGEIASARQAPAIAAADARRAIPGSLITSVEPVGANLIVVRTEPGAANAVAIDIDRRHDAHVAGTVAGDDTILIAVRSRSAQGRVLAQLPRPRPRPRRAV